MSNNKLVKITQKDAVLIGENENMSSQLAGQYFMKNNEGKFFILRAGLLYKLEKKFPRASINVFLIEDDRLPHFRTMLGLKENAPLVVAMSVITTKTGETFTDYGTATFTNCSNRSYMLEMACTRASNRAIRLATTMGYASVEEMEDAPRQPLPPINEVIPRSNTQSYEHAEQEEQNRVLLIASCSEIVKDLGFDVNAFLTKKYKKDTDLNDLSLGHLLAFEKKLIDTRDERQSQSEPQKRAASKLIVDDEIDNRIMKLATEKGIELQAFIKSTHKEFSMLSELTVPMKNTVELRLQGEPTTKSIQNKELKDV